MSAFQTCFHDIEEDVMHTHVDGHFTFMFATNSLHHLGTMLEIPYQVIPQVLYSLIGDESMPGQLSTYSRFWLYSSTLGLFSQSRIISIFRLRFEYFVAKEVVCKTCNVSSIYGTPLKIENSMSLSISKNVTHLIKCDTFVAISGNSLSAFSST